MKKIMTVFGTRPEAIKMCPLVKELEKNKNIKNVVCVTGQHKEMLQQVLDVFEVIPNYNLEIMQHNQDLFDVTINILNGIKAVLKEEKPDIVLVHGDTTTAYVVALACFYLNIKIGHVEAGLRTYDIKSPFPEEFNRQSISLISDYHFAPTEASKRNLLSEKVDLSKVFVTGNTVIDALDTTVSSDYHHEIFDWLGEDRMILLTTHRRENMGTPMKNIFKAINNITSMFNDVKVVFPIHMNPKIREEANKHLRENNKVRIIEPLDVIDFHNFMNRAYFILSDSGGVQEEAPSLGVPVLVLRNSTERPEGIDAGTIKLVGTKTESIINEASLLLSNKIEYEQMSKAKNPYGDGTASKQIAEILYNVLGVNK